MEEYFFSDDEGQGHERFTKIFLEVYNNFETENSQWLKQDLPKMSMVKQNQKIHALTNKMIKSIKKETLKEFKVYEQTLVDQTKNLLDGILEVFVSTESHTNWKD